MNLKGFCSAVLLCFGSLSAANVQAADGQPEVLASVKPLQLIAQAVVGDLGHTDVLIPPGASPHHYALKPSDRRKLKRADIMLWIGPDLELFLEKVVASSQVPALTLLPQDSHADETAEEHAAHADKIDEKEGHDHHDHGGVDPHLWLNPMEALKAAEQLSQRLATLYPQHKVTLEQNLLDFSARLITVDRQLKADLAPLQARGFFVFHDAYGYFMERYQLNMLGAFTVDPGRPIGTRHLADIRKQLKADAAVCVFGEPQFKAAVVKSVTEGLSVGYGELDPLALDARVSTTGYTDYLQQLGNQVKSCLSKS
ncbi:MAG: zinc ABC transporter substrate-binding protein ZnuA [Marinobacterium sp.]|nr:zinc ABC transporter substrate-binding protein ZnuA [Marinobacterium sp.]